MTSVTCNVCTKDIASESDRIYCFGGCEQILHSRCADLSSAAATALRENNSLKYMCFECRKKQTTLNAIQKQCTQLVAKVDDLRELVNKHESMLTSLTTAYLEKIESTLLPRILSAVKTAPSSNPRACNIADDESSNRSNSGQIAVNNSSYANVTRSSVNSSSGKDKSSATDRAPAVSDSLETAPTPTDHGGLLRSGKRRFPVPVPHTNVSAPVSSPVVPQSSGLETPLSQQRKANAVAKLEQTVLFKPMKDQPAEKTKSDICAKLDPVNFAVKDVWLRELGEVAVRCGSKDLALSLVSSATTIFSGKYSIEIQKLLKPRIKIIGFSDNMSNDVLLTKLKKQNNLMDPFDLKVIRVMKNEKRQSNQMSAIIETDARGFDILMKRQNVYVGWDRCRLVDAIDARRCFNCSEFGHISAVCTKPACCPKCAGDHKAEDCVADFEKCINCHLENAKRNSKYDELLDIAHSAWSHDCPVNRKRLAKARQRIDFTS